MTFIDLLIGFVATCAFSFVTIERYRKRLFYFDLRRALFLDSLLVLCALEILLDSLHDFNVGDPLIHFVILTVRSAIGVGAFALAVTFPAKEVS